MPELDSVRGAAILMVFVFHAFFGVEANRPVSLAALQLAHYGWAGVNLFFVLSGFLITGILLDGREKPNYYRAFYWRRALRILPAYYALLMILLLLGALPFVHLKITTPFVLLSFVYLSNLTPLFGIPIGYGPLWSLAVEEHFYLLWPAVVRNVTRKLLAGIAFIGILAIWVARFFAARKGGLWLGNYTWLTADALAMGALLALFARSRRVTRKKLLALSAAACGVAVVAGVAAARVALQPEVVAFKLVAVNLLSLSLVAMALWLGSAGRLSLQPLRFYGYISYGLYLIHMLGLWLYDELAKSFVPQFSVGDSMQRAWLRFGIVLTFTTFAAWLSRRTYEELFLSMKDKLAV